MTATGGTLFLALGGLVEAKTADLGAPAAHHGLAVYRGSHDGKIYVSTDGGRSWSLHTDFGPDYDITRVSRTSRNRVVARLRYRRYDFRLVLDRDQRTWRTL